MFRSLVAAKNNNLYLLTDVMSIAIKKLELVFAVYSAP